MRVALLLAVLLLAGCMGPSAPTLPGEPGGSAPSAGPTPAAREPASPTPATPPPDPNATVREAEPVPLRVVAVGDHSALPFPMRLVFTEPEEWESFWREHQGGGYAGENMTPPQTPPAPPVDFATERAVVVMLGDSPSPCWAVRVTDATRWEGATTLTVTTYMPAPEDACPALVAQPYAIVALPDDGSEVAYRDEGVVGRPTGAG